MADDDLDFGETLRGISAGQKVFDRYVLKKILGRGGMGIVWLAHDEKLDREVALKFLPEMVAMDAEALVDLKRETRRSLDLTHPRIVRIYDLVEDERSAAIAMEYIAGGSLGQLKLDQRHHCFEVAAIESWVKQLCDALTYAHDEAKVVHRDLKPSNLMLDENGNLKVADFGIAANISDSVSRVSQQAGSSGTPLYMSPQQMMGEDPAVTDDVYALGATLYELLAGKPPFYTGNVMMQVMNKPAPSLGERRAKVEEDEGIVLGKLPEAWGATIAACLAKEAIDRPHSVAEVWARLSGATKYPKPERPDEVRVGASLDAAAAGRVKRPVARASFGNAPVAKILAGVVTAVVLVAGAGWWWGVEQPQRQAAEAERIAMVAAQAAEQAADEEREEAKARKLAKEQAVADAQRLAVEQATADEAARLAALRIQVSVSSEPGGATLRLDGRDVGQTPLQTSEGLALGTYTGELELDGYDRQELHLEVTERGARNWSVDLVRSRGVVEWEIDRKSKVTYWLHDEGSTIDGRSQADAEGMVGEAIVLPTGKYWGYFSHLEQERVPVAVEVPFNFEVRAGETTKVSGDVSPVMVSFKCPDDHGVTYRLAGRSLRGEVVHRKLSELNLFGLPPGEFEARFSKDGWPDQVREFEAIKGQTTQVEVEFPQGTVVVDSEPRGAEVWLNGEVVGTTPTEGERINPGSLGYTLRLDGYKSAEVQGFARPGEQLTLNAMLEKFPGFRIPDLGMSLRKLEPGVLSFTHPETGQATTIPVPGSFWIGVTEVTQFQWTELMGSNPSANLGSGQLPVDSVSWRRAVDYCKRLTKRERSAGRLPAGYEYNLPTDIQWEYACRADGIAEVGEDDFWHLGNSGGSSKPVGTSTANKWGLYDLFGNVGELCLDYNKEQLPWGYVGFFITRAASYRGGFSSKEAAECGPHYRMFDTLGRSQAHVGFRVALVRDN